MTLFRLTLLLGCFLFYFVEPFYGSKLYRQALMLLQKGNLEKAKETLYIYYQNYPNSYTAPHALYQYTKLIKPLPKVIYWLKRIEKEYPNFGKLDIVLDNLGTLYYILDDFRRSEYYYKQLSLRFEKSPLRIKAFYYRVSLLLLKKKYDSARRILQKVLKKSSEVSFLNNLYYKKLYELLARSYFYEGKYLQAVDIYQKILKWASIRPGVLYFLATSYIRLGKKKQAMKYSKLLLKKYPKGLETPFLSKELLVGGSFEKKETVIKSLPKKKVAQYKLQAGVFSRKQNAQWVVDKITQEKVASRQVEIMVNNQLYYKIIVEGLESRSEALEVSQRLRSIGIKTFMIQKIQED